MKLKSIALCIGLSLLTVSALISCSYEETGETSDAEPELQTENPGPTLVNELGINVPVSSMETGHMRVLITKELDATLKESIKENGILPVSDIKSAKTIASKMGVYKIQRVFPYAGKFEARTRKAGLDRWYDVWFDSSYPIENALTELSTVKEFEKVEYRPQQKKMFSDEVYPDLGPEFVSTKASTSAPFDDPYFSKQWGLYNTGQQSKFVAGCDINVVPAWQSIATGNPDVVVAVVDGGIQYDHEDLAANMWTDPSNNNRSYGFNFVKYTYAITPEDHGTHCAGVIAAVNDNGKGVCGIAGGDYAKGQKGVRLMSCQIFDGDDSGSGSVAIKWAADHGAVIAQNSWGYGSITYVPLSDRQAIDYFNTYAGLDENGNQTGPMAGGIVVFSAGNESATDGFPAEYEGVVSVSAVGPDFMKAYYSNYGDWVDLCAPGGDYNKGEIIYSTITGNSYGYMQGTSMACPHVSGVAALIVSKYGGPGFTRDMLWNRLVNTATDVTKYNKTNKIGGLVNTLQAMASLSTIAPDPVKEFSAKPLEANYVSIKLTIPADEDDGSAFGVNVYYDKSPITTTAGVPYKSFQFGGLKAGQEYADTLSGLSFDTKYYLRCVAYDIAGNRSELSDEITATTSKNNPPVITVQSDLVFDVRAHETKYIPFSYYDADGHRMSPILETTSAADTVCHVGKNKSQIVIIGTNDKPGTYTSTLRVKDEYDGEASFKYTFTIYGNHAPVKVKDFGNIILTKTGETAEFPLSDYITDEDGEVLSAKISNDAPSVANVFVGNGKISITGLSAGSTNIEMIATDALGEAVSTSFSILVRTSGNDYDVFPNPVKTNMYVRTGADEEQATVKVVSSTGSVICNETTTASAFNPIAVDMSACAPGMYKVYVTFGGKTYESTVAKI